MKSIIAAAGLVAVAQAFTQPVQPPTYGSLLTPDVNNPVTTGQDYTITWTPKQPAAGVTVSLVLCNGPSTNCVLQNTAIVEGVPAAQGSYKWSVPCSLPSGVQSTATGYGMLIIVDGTGEFQYSTQFSVNAGASCGTTTTTTTTSSSTSSTTSSSTTTTSSKSSSSTTSGSATSSSSSSSTSSVNTDGWAPWATASSSTLTTSIVSTTPVSTTPVAVTTSKPAVTTTPAYTTPSTTSASSSVVTTPLAFTGAAAVPTAFVNAAGLFGAAALAALAL